MGLSASFKTFYNQVIIVQLNNTAEHYVPLYLYQLQMCWDTASS